MRFYSLPAALTIGAGDNLAIDNENVGTRRVEIPLPVTAGGTGCTRAATFISNNNIATLTSGKIPVDQILSGIVVVYGDKTLALSDLGTTQDCQNQTDITITIPEDVLPVGAEIDFVKRGDGNVTFAGAEGVTIQSVDSCVDLKTTYGGVYAKQMNANIWLLRGDLE